MAVTQVPAGPVIGIAIGLPLATRPHNTSPPPSAPELDFSKAANSQYLTLGVV